MNGPLLSAGLPAPDVRSAATITQIVAENTRRSNLSLVFSLVHHNGMLTRAQLTRSTGLNRSTVASLIGELASEGLVVESAAVMTNQIGRPSQSVHPSSTIVAIAVNPEVDAVTVGLVGLGGSVLKRIRVGTERVPTAREATNMAGAVIDGMRPELDARFRVVGLGVAVPGLTGLDDDVVAYAPRLQWRNEPIASLLSAATGYAAVAANDAALGATAAQHFGESRGSQSLLYLHGGASGIAGGVIDGGRVRRGVDGYAGQLGHTLVNTNGILCHCGARGCLETEVSLDRLQDLLGLTGAAGDDVEHAIRSTRSPAVAAELQRQADYLSVTLRNAVNVFNPERIVLGGFLGTLFEFAGDRLAGAVAAGALYGPRDDVQLSRAHYGSDLLMLGAAEFAFAPLLADPLGERG